MAQPTPTPHACPSITLTAADVTRFRIDGWWHAGDGVVPAQDLPAIRRTYDRLFAAEGGKDAGQHFALYGGAAVDTPVVHQILGPELHAPELLQTTTWANARAIMTALLGREPGWMGGHAIRKPARCPLPTPWHQDEAYWNPATYHLGLSLWIPLQDVDERSGCMHFVPGSQLSDILPHRQAGGDPQAKGLELVPGYWDVDNHVAVPLRAGGCTAHGGRMLHHTTANQADVPRRAWIIMGGIAAPPRRIPAHLPWLAGLHAARAGDGRD